LTIPIRETSSLDPVCSAIPSCFYRRANSLLVTYIVLSVPSTCNAWHDNDCKQWDTHKYSIDIWRESASKNNEFTADICDCMHIVHTYLN